MTSKDELSTRIRQLAGEGKSLGEIAVALERSENRISQLSREEGITIHDVSRRGKYNTTKIPEVVAREINELLREGMITSREELADRVGVSPKYVGEYGVEFPSTLEPYRWRPELDALIAEGKDLPEMAGPKGITRQAVDSYIERSGQRTFWHERMRERQEREEQERIPEREKQKTLEQIATQVWALVERKANEGTWAEQTAWAYYQQRGRSGPHLPFEKLVAAFQVYDEARQQGEKVTIRELARRAGWNEQTLTWVYGRMGINKSFRRKIVLTTGHQDVLKKVIYLDLAAEDIGYFMRIPFSNVNKQRLKQGFKRRWESLYSLSPRDKVSGVSYGQLTYGLASQIYEAVDLGFTGKETQQLLSMPEKMLHPKVIEYALQHRPEIEQTIIHALDMMFPRERHEKPYREK